jgi:tripartite-type tricarboxylate transporter receptor subunit TctC
LIVGFAAGGSADIAARLIGQWLWDRLGQPVIIENRTGAASNLAAEMAARAAPDGYTLLFATTTNAINATLYENLGFDLNRDFAPVAGVIRVPNIMEVHPSVPAKTVPEFIAYTKANPGKINMASTGNGTSIHLAGELFKVMTGVDLLHVPYRSPPQALTDLMGGQVQVMFDVMTQSIEHIRAGKLRALAVTTATRSTLLSETPTVGEFVPGYEASSWNGVIVPKYTPVEFIDRLNKEINAALVDPKINARFTDLGGTPLSGSPADLGKHIAAETEKWAKVIKFAGIRSE